MEKEMKRRELWADYSFVIKGVVVKVTGHNCEDAKEKALKLYSERMVEAR